MIECWSTLPYKTYSIDGEEAADFIQGQITQDINIITNDYGQYAAYCDHKGRLLAKLLIFYIKDNIHISLDSAISKQIINRLNMYILRSKVKILETEYSTFGMTQQIASKLCCHLNIDITSDSFAITSNDELSIIRLADTNNYELYSHPKITKDIYKYLSNIQPESLKKYRITQLINEEVHITPDTIGAIMPQNTSLESVGAINYQKGCYVGQEIIARSKYRGNNQKIMLYAKTKLSKDISYNSLIRHQKRDISKVFDCIHDENTWLSAVLPLSIIGKNTQINNQDIVFHKPDYFINSNELQQ